MKGKVEGFVSNSPFPSHDQTGPSGDREGGSVGDDERAPLVKEDGEPEVELEQGRRDHTAIIPRLTNVLPDDPPRRPARTDGERAGRELVARKRDV